MVKVTTKRDAGGVRVIVTFDDLDVDIDEMVFTFTGEGLITDAVKGGEVVGTDSQMYDDLPAYRSAGSAGS